MSDKIEVNKFDFQHLVSVARWVAFDSDASQFDLAKDRLDAASEKFSELVYWEEQPEGEI